MMGQGFGDNVAAMLVRVVFLLVVAAALAGLAVGVLIGLVL
jgi:hypothetical protein